MLPKTSAYVKSYDGQTKSMYFFIEDDDLLEKYNSIQDKVSSDIKKEFDSETVYDKNYLKIKIKSHGDEVTDFYDKKFLIYTLITLAQEYLAWILLGFFKECKHIEKKVVRHIHDNLSDFSSSSDESDEE